MKYDFYSKLLFGLQLGRSLSEWAKYTETVRINIWLAIDTHIIANW